MTGKDRLHKILNGQIPDTPPHWELVFQNEKAMFGMDRDAVPAADQLAFQMDVYHRLVDEYGWAAIRGGYDPDEIEQTKKFLGHKALIPAYEGNGVFWMPSGEDMMDFVVRMFERPAELHTEARRKCDAAKLFFKQAVDAGADFFVLTYDFGYNDAPFISPDQFAEFVAPYLTELVRSIHNLNRKVLLHSDGCINLILDQLYSTGLDGYQSVDPQGHMDIRKVRELYPDWILMGNVACNLLQDTNTEKIRESVRYCMDHGGVGKPYIFSTSNCIFDGMPADSYKTMYDEYARVLSLK